MADTKVDPGKLAVDTPAETPDPNTPPEGEGTPPPVVTSPPAPPADDDDDDDDEDLESEKFDKERAIAKITKVNSEAKNLRKEVKRLREIEAKVLADEEASRSETDKAIARAEAAEKKLRDKELEGTTEAIKARFDLPAKVLDKLEGENAEELIASAEEWAEALGLEDKTKPAKKAKAKVKAEELDGGTDPGKRAPDGRTVDSVVAGLRLWH
jgi:hypothetical protein